MNNLNTSLFSSELAMVAASLQNNLSTVSIRSEQTLQQIIDSLPVVLIWKDRQSVIQGCNRPMLDITGFGCVSDVVGKTDYEMPWTKEEADWYRECDRRIMDADEPELNIIEPLHKGDGSKAWLSTSKVPLHDAKGDVSGILVMIEDVTARKVAEAALIESEDKFRSIVETVSDTIYIHDADGIFSYVSPRVAEILGYEPKELINKPFMPYVHEADLQNCKDVVQAVFETRTKFSKLEVRGLTKVGEWKNLSLNLAPHRTQDGRVVSLIGTIRDVTAEKQAAALLEDYANQQALLYQLTTQTRKSLDVNTILQTAVAEIRSMFNLDMAAFAWVERDVQPVMWHLTAESVVDGYPSFLGEFSEEKVGPVEQRLMFDDVIAINSAADYDEPQHRQFMQEVGIRSSMLVAVRTKKDVGVIICNTMNQEHCWQATEISLVKMVAEQLAIAIDQAQLYEQSQQQAEQLAQTLKQLQSTQTKMIQAEKMSGLGQMVAGVAHEINNPVNFIHANLQPASDYAKDLLGLVHLYQQEHTQPSPALEEALEEAELDFIETDFIRLLESMSVGTQRIREIVLSLRNFSRLDESDIKAADVHEGIESTLVILAHRLKSTAQQVEIRVVKDYGNLPEIDCYPGQLNQVFMNILSNAIDALQEIPNPEIKLSTALQQENIVIQISDNGSGIPEAAKENIFDPFFTTKPVGQGTGMGLSISYQIIAEKHGGQLSVHSMPEKGSTFTIELPIKHAANSEMPE